VSAPIQRNPRRTHVASKRAVFRALAGAELDHFRGQSVFKAKGGKAENFMGRPALSMGGSANGLGLHCHQSMETVSKPTLYQTSMLLTLQLVLSERYILILNVLVGDTVTSWNGW
jgi:hypothetical protein